MSRPIPPSKPRVVIFTALYFLGILTQLALFILVFVWGITGTMNQNLAAVPILISQGVAIMGSGFWWLPTCAVLTGLPRARGNHG